MVFNDRMVSAIISFLVPGLGHLIKGNIVRGLVMFIIAVIIDILVITCFNFILGYILAIVYALFATRDVYRSY